MRNRDNSSRKNRRDTEPTTAVEVEGTDFDILLWKGVSQMGETYYHWRLVRTDGQRYFATNRPAQVFDYLRAFTVLVAGLSKLENLDQGLRDKLMALGTALKAIPLPDVVGLNGSSSNGLDRVFAA